MKKQRVKNLTKPNKLQGDGLASSSQSHKPQGYGLPSFRQSHKPQGDGLASNSQSHKQSYEPENSPQCLKLDILNLSAVGAFIFGCNKFKLGDEVVLKMKLAPSQDEFQFEAKVVWIPDKQVQPHEYPGIGVEFCNISSRDQQKLAEFIERNLSFMSSD